jgi:DNA-binding MarR family transcriptional regulator
MHRKGGAVPVLEPQQKSPDAAQAELIEGIMDNLRRVFKAINDRSKVAKHIEGLTIPQLWALKVLAEYGPVRVSELATRMYLHPSTVVGILDRLEAKKLAARERFAGDRRVVNVGLTEAGKALVKRPPAVPSEMLLAGLETLSARELRTVARGLEIQVQLLHAQALPPQLLLSTEVNVPRRRLRVAPDGRADRPADTT